jgi:hypothetical protein
MQKIAVMLIALMLASCGHRRDDAGYTAIDCSGWFEDWSDCVAEADAMCEKKGGYVARWHEGADDRILRVRCAGG